MGRLYRLFAAIATFAVLAAPTVARAEDVLKLALPHKGFWDTGFTDYGQRMGFFEQEGLKLELLYTAGGSETEQAVMSGTVDLGMADGLLGVLAAFGKGVPLTVVSAEMTGSPDLFWYVRADSPIKSLKDAGGKTMGFSAPGSSTNLVALLLAQQAGTPIKVMQAGDTPGTLTQVMSGQIDIGWSAVPFAFDQIDAGKIRIVARGSDVPEIAHQTVRVNIALADTLKNKRDQLVRFMRAYQRTLDWAYSDPKAVQWLADDAHVSLEDAARVPTQFIPKTALSITPVGQLDLSIKQAIDTKRLAGPLTSEQITKLIDIVYTPPQN
jgi:NitT/TauT family transport system substrate-binding protein